MKIEFGGIKYHEKCLGHKVKQFTISKYVMSKGKWVQQVETLYICECGMEWNKGITGIRDLKEKIS